MCFVDHEGRIPGDLPARFAIPGSPIWDVVRLCVRYSMLPDFLTERIVSKNPCLAPFVARLLGATYYHYLHIQF